MPKSLLPNDENCPHQKLHLRGQVLSGLVKLRAARLPRRKESLAVVLRRVPRLTHLPKRIFARLIGRRKARGGGLFKLRPASAQKRSSYIVMRHGIILQKQPPLTAAVIFLVGGEGFEPPTPSV